MDDSVEDEILRLLSRGNWEEILEKFDRNKFLPWVWPDRKNLEFIGKSVRRRKLNSLISVGCGSGLLEWLLATATGMKVTGIETDGSWWKSKYSSGTFVPTTFLSNATKGEFRMETSCSALLFCYFNNLEAFLNYIKNYKGDCFVAVESVGLATPDAELREAITKQLPSVIGPGPGRGTYTIPEPFNLPGGLEESWELSESQEIRSSKDFIAVYVRKCC